MPLLGFKQEFAKLVEAGVKKQTIRALRKVPIRAGDRLVLAEGVRTKNFRRIGEAVCDVVMACSLHRTAKGNLFWTVEGIRQPTSNAVMAGIAKNDGFHDAYELTRWFEENHLDRKGVEVFIGQIIRW